MKECEVCGNNPIRSIRSRLCDGCWQSWCFSELSTMDEWESKRRVELSTKYLEEALEES